MSEKKYIYIRVKGYWRKDGTWVSGYTRRIGRKSPYKQLTINFSTSD